MSSPATMSEHKPEPLDEIEEIRLILERNRRAAAVASVSGFVLFNLAFWGVMYGMPNTPLTLGMTLAMAAGAFVVAAGIYFTMKSKKKAFDAAPVREVEPELGAAELAALRKELTAPAATVTSAIPRSDDEGLADLGTDVEGTVARVRAIQRQNAVAGLVSSVAGLLSTSGYLYLLDAYYTRSSEGAGYYDQLEVSGREFIFGIGAGVAVGLWLFRRLKSPLDPLADDEAPAAAAEPPNDWFERSLGTTGSLGIRQAMEVGQAVGFDSSNCFEVLDGGGAALCVGVEKAGFLLRTLVPARFRSYEVELRDVDRRVMSLRCSVRLGLPRMEVRGEDSALGRVEGRFALFGRSYVLRDSEGQECFTMKGGLFFTRRFRICRKGESVAELHKKRRGFLSSPLAGDRFELELPKDVSLEERELLLAAVLFVDHRHF